MKKLWFGGAIAAAIVAAGVGIWLVARDAAPEEAVSVETPEAALGRALAGGGVAAADWVNLAQGSVERAESGRYAFLKITGADGRTAWVYLVRLDDGTWKVVSLTEGPPQCAAVERYGFPSAMIADCRVGEVQTVADALALAIAGGDVSGVRLVGTIELPPDPGCGCVLLSSGGASVKLNLTAAQLEAAGIHVGDTVVISGGLGDDLSVDASSAILATSDGTVAGAPGGGGQQPGGQTSSKDDRPQTTRPPSGTPAPEPATPPPLSGGVSGGGAVSVPGFPDWKPRRRYATTWYANPFDLDSSASEEPTYEGS